MSHTVDWFSEHIKVWEKRLAHLRDTPCQLLEIGSMQGLSASWMLKYLCKDSRSSLVCIDPWLGDPDDNSGQNGERDNQLFWENVTDTLRRDRLITYRDYSHNVLPRLFAQKQKFDFVYIDGDHEASSVFQDFCGVWPLLEPGSIVCFDDYKRRVKYAKVQPTFAIDAIVEAFKHKITDVVAKDKQLFLRRA